MSLHVGLRNRHIVSALKQIAAQAELTEYKQLVLQMFPSTVSPPERNVKPDSDHISIDGP